MSAGQRVSKTFRALTTTLFRCPGLKSESSAADKLGLHDLAWWLVMIAVAVAWYVMIYQPQQQRLQILNGRMKVLNGQLHAEQVELKRVRREIHALKTNDIRAWERAARASLGWLKQGEITDIQGWKQRQMEEGLPDPTRSRGTRFSRRGYFQADQYARRR